VLVDTRINIVLTGHEHLYERIKPQRGIQHFVSGGGGRYLYNYHQSDFDVVGLSDHHFMVFEAAGDRMFFEAITHAQKVIDCGILYRTPDAASKKPDDTTAKWLAQCDAEVPARPRSTAQR
jgi:hypothetical protein